MIVIAGGDGKSQNFAPLREAFRGKVRCVVLIGRDAAAIEQVLRDVCAIVRSTSMPEAVRAAAKVAQPGDTVLLSPACASLDMFRNYAHRGEVFSSSVRELAAMNAIASMAFAQSGHRKGGVRIDVVLVALLAAIVLFGLVMVTSASISVASQEAAANSFAYLEKQLLFVLVGVGAGAIVFCLRTDQLERLSVPLLFIGLALLLIVAVPGIGHRSHGSRRWFAAGRLCLPGLRARKAADPHLCGQLRGSQGRAVARHAVRVAKATGRAAAGRWLAAGRAGHGRGNGYCLPPASSCCFWPAGGCAG